ncbi:MAG: DUF2142 domain-containing protein [Oscillospiraceae bacterium]|nr:DUF2142 domain-containing protein [Oscillospiraceae bacterium]
MNSKLRSIYIIAPFLIIFCSISYMILHAAKAAPELKTFGLLVILFTAMIVLLSIGVLIRRAESIKYEKLFPFLALGFGLLFLTVITPISVPDEATHYTASYIISNKILMKPNPEEANAADFEFIDFTKHSNTSDAYRRIISSFLEEPKEEGSINIAELSIRSLYYFAEYLPQAMGIAVARLLHLNFLQTFYVGRLFNLLFYVGCLAIAIRRVPRFKLTFGMIGILPMALQQAASYSYDSYINGLALIYIASLIKACAEENRLTKSDFLVFLICSVLITPAKGAYSFLVLLYSLIPTTRFGSIREKRVSFVCIICACVLIFAVTAIPSVKWIVNSSVSEQNTYSVKELLSMPGHVIVMVRNTLKKYLISWIKEAAGEKLSGLTLQIPEWNVASLLILLFLSAQNTENDAFQITKQMRERFIMISVLVVVAFMLTMLITWSDRYLNYISGVQGRYFIPILPLLIMSTSNSHFIVKDKIEIPICILYVFLASYPILYIVEYTIAN